ncbi:MAG: exosortase B [Betaproteobacteria bacterium]|nr:exosortase B [Betaproteobacteria bacterium]
MVLMADGKSLTRDKERFPLLFVLAGLCVMYAPTFISLFQDIRHLEDLASRPIMLAISVWLFYRKWPEMLAAREGLKGSVAGWPILVVGLLAYIVGRSQNVPLLDVGSLFWVLPGVGLVLFGTRPTKVAWFPLLFMLFLIPLPDIVVDAVTIPIKFAVAHAAEYMLNQVGYPVARDGVILQIGQHKLLVADISGGLYTLLILVSLGLLYLFLIRHESFIRNIVLALLTVPISFAANVIFVVMLVLVVYHFGEEAGMGFIRGLLDGVRFLSVLLLMIGVDALTRVIFVRGKPFNTSSLSRSVVLLILFIMLTPIVTGFISGIVLFIANIVSKPVLFVINIVSKMKSPYDHIYLSNQDFIHNFAGIALFLSALFLIVCIDRIVFPRNRSGDKQECSQV